MRPLCRPAFAAALVFLGACARNPSPELPAPVAASPGADSIAFDRFTAEYVLERRGQAGNDTAAWIHQYEASAETESANRAAAQLARLRAIDTTRLSVPQRIDWLLVESWL